MQNFKLIVQMDHDKVIDEDTDSKTFGQVISWPDEVLDTDQGFNNDGFKLVIQQLDGTVLKDQITIIGSVNASNERVLSIVPGSGRAPISIVTRL